MDFDLLKTLPGSFRGANFLIASNSTEGGRKTVSHEFINSDRRYIEDLGLNLKTYRVDCITTRGSNLLTSDYYGNRNALIRALETKGEGLLIHPLFGSLRVNVINFTVYESMNDFGRANFSITFAESKPNIFPVNAGSNLSQIFQLASRVYDTILTNVNTVYRIKNVTAQTIIDSINSLRNIGLLFNAILNKYRSGSQTPNQFYASLQNFNRNIVIYAQNPDKMGPAIIELFNTANDFAATPLDAFNLGVDTFTFGDTDTPIIGSTVDLQDRLNNRTLINQVVKTCGLIQAYRNAPEISYRTENDVFQKIAILEKQYNKFDTYKLIDAEIQNETKELRNQVRIFFDSIQVNISKIITITTPVIPMTVLAYNYYGNTDLVDALLELNPNQDPSFVEGEVQIFTQ